MTSWAHYESATCAHHFGLFMAEVDPLELTILPGDFPVHSDVPEEIHLLGRQWSSSTYP